MNLHSALTRKTGIPGNRAIANQSKGVARLNQCLGMGQCQDIHPTIALHRQITACDRPKGIGGAIAHLKSVLRLQR